MGIPDDRGDEARERGADRWLGGDAATVVGDQHRGGGAERVPRVRGQRAAAARLSARVETDHRAAARADAHLLRRRPSQSEIADAHARFVQELRQGPARRIVAERADQRDGLARGSRERGGQAGAAWARPLDDRVDHRNGRVRRQPLGAPVEVAVEQRVADDDEAHPRAPVVVRNGAPSASAVSTAAHSR